MKCPKCGAWSRARATHCECGHVLIQIGAPAVPGKKRVPAPHAGMAIAEFLGATNRARGVTKEGKELPQLTRSPALREELSYLMTAAVYLALRGGTLSRETADAVFDSFLGACESDFTQRPDDRYSTDRAWERARSCVADLEERRKTGLTMEEASMLMAQRFAEMTPDKKERPALVALGGLLFGTILVSATEFLAKITAEYEVG